MFPKFIRLGETSSSKNLKRPSSSSKNLRRGFYLRWRSRGFSGSEIYFGVHMYLHWPDLSKYIVVYISVSNTHFYFFSTRQTLCWGRRRTLLGALLRRRGNLVAFWIYFIGLFWVSTFVNGQIRRKVEVLGAGCENKRCCIWNSRHRIKFSEHYDVPFFCYLGFEVADVFPLTIYILQYVCVELLWNSGLTGRSLLRQG